MKTCIAAALALATVASAHAAPLDQFDWRTQKGFEQAYREGVQYGFQHGSSFHTVQWCSAENCLIIMDYDVADESYAFLTWLGSADNRGNEICAERPDHHLTCANDHGRVWTMRDVDGDLKEVRRWQKSWPVEPSPVTKLIDTGFAAGVRTKKGFEQAYHEGMQYGFDHGSAFHVDPKCNTEKCSVSMEYSIDSEQYEMYTWLGSAELHENHICVERRDDQVHLRERPRASLDQAVCRWGLEGDCGVWQDSWPVKPTEPSLVAKLKNIGAIAFDVVLLGAPFLAIAYGVAIWLIVGSMRLAAGFGTASLFVICRLPAGWKNRLAFVAPSLASIERWRVLKVAAARVLIAAYVLALRKRRALKLVGRDFETFVAQRRTLDAAARPRWPRNPSGAAHGADRAGAPGQTQRVTARD